MSRDRWLRGDDWQRAAREAGVPVDVARALYAQAARIAQDGAHLEQLYARALRSAATTADTYRDFVPVPGKQTRVTDDSAPRMAELAKDGPGKWSLSMFEDGELTVGQARPVHASVAIAARGVEGDGERLPHHARIQAAFGRHAVGDLRAHIGGAAGSAARRLGAHAYAVGNRIAFAATPSLHTAAHEAAHAVQQRAGVALKSGIDQPGDAYETHADQVADAVVRGESAESLLDAMAGRGATAAPSMPVVQRQVAPAGTGAGSGSAAPADPASRHPTMDQITAAADTDKGKEDLDLSWIDRLPVEIQNDIDTDKFSVLAARTADHAAIRGDHELPKIDADYRKALRALDKKAPDYAAQKAALDTQHTSAVDARKLEVTNATEAAVRDPKRIDTVVDPKSATVPRKDGKMLARANFMSWAIDVLGSPEAVKAHFMGMQEVSGAGGMILAKSAAERFKQARTDFENKHPGFTFPGGGGFQSRDFHEARKGIGMLGHALGFSLDMRATENPNIKQDAFGQNGSYEFLIDHAGADAEGKPGRAKMSLDSEVKDVHKFGASDRAIETLGKDLQHTTPVGEHLLDAIRSQFGEMLATSDAMQASIADKLGALQTARDLYFNIPAKQAKLTALQGKLQGDRAAKQELAKNPKESDGTPRTIKAIRSQWESDAKELADDIKNDETTVKDTLESVFRGWHDKFQKIIDDDTAKQHTAEVSIAELDAQSKALKSIDLKSADAMASLTAFATAHSLEVRHVEAPSKTHPHGKSHIPQNARELQAFLVEQLKAKANPYQDGNSDKSVTWQKNEISIVSQYRDWLTKPKAVFGRGVQNMDGGWSSAPEVENISVSQLAEHGFVKANDMSSPPDHGRKAVFNAEVFATLARFGFSPGATYGDTMHFDFIEGFNAAVAGGRASENFASGKYGPTGEKPPASSKPVAPPASTRKP